MSDWEKGVYGVSERRREAVKQVKQLVYAFLEQAGMSGKIHPTTYIWLTKNWQKYSDNLPAEVKNAQTNKPKETLEQIAEEFGGLLPESEQ